MPENRKKSYGTEIGIAIAVALPLIYMVSLGFAVRHFSAGPAPSPPVEKFLDVYFSPLIWLHRNTPLEKPLEWYIELWVK